MPTKPGDTLQRHSFNQSRKISVPIRRWLEIKLKKLSWDECRTWTVKSESGRERLSQGVKCHASLKVTHLHFCIKQLKTLHCVGNWSLTHQYLSTEENWIPSFLGIPRNSQKFPTMQICSDFKSLELLGAFGKVRLQFNEDLEFFGIPRNSQLYKLPTIWERWNYWEFLGI